MQISLISPYGSISNIGLRTISSVLKESGFSTQIFFLPVPASESPLNLAPYFIMEYPEDLLNQLAELTKDSQIIGISLMNIYKQVGIKITSKLKRDDNLIIWGGSYPTIHPQEALEYADGVCIGDGEHAMLELANKLYTNQPLDSINNLWFREKKYPSLQSVSDISSLPLPDYGTEGHFIYEENSKELIPLKSFDDYQKYFDRSPKISNNNEGLYIYRIETTRGCPHNCTYCENNVLKKVQTQKLRYKSIERIKKELIFVKDKFPFVSSIAIEDDTFIARKDAAQIASLLKEFNYPFRCLISPLHVTEELIKNLVENGLNGCFVGLQSRAPRIEQYYNRTHLNKKIDTVFEIFKKNYPDIPFLVDILVDNPWEKVDETIFTLHYLLDNLPPKAFLGINSLVFYEGTQLWEKAKQDNLLDFQQSLKTWHWHRQKKIHYTTLLFFLLKLRFPRGFIRFLSRKPFLFLFERPLFTNSIFPSICRILKKIVIFLNKAKTSFLPGTREQRAIMLEENLKN